MQLAKGIEALRPRRHAHSWALDDILQAQQELANVEPRLRHQRGHTAVVEPQQPLRALRKERPALERTLVGGGSELARPLLHERDDDGELGYAPRGLALHLAQAARPLAALRVLLERCRRRTQRARDRAELREAVGDEEDEYDEVAVGRAFDLEVAEEGVGAEEVESFVEDIGFICSSWFGELS